MGYLCLRNAKRYGRIRYTESGVKLQLWIGFIILVHAYVSALTLPQCDGPLGKKAIELRENVAQQTVTCDGAGQTGQVQWRYVEADGTYKTLVTCSSPSSCTADFSDRFATGTRNSTSSTLTFVTQASRAVHGARSVSCFMTIATQVTCQLDVVYPSDVSTPSCSITNDLKIQCSCDITKAFSTRDRYSCQWFQNVGGQVSAIPAASSTVSSPTAVDTDYKKFDCSFSIDLPAVTGAYSYDVKVFPGNVTETAGNTINIVEPSSPNPGCPSGYVRDGFPLSCTCNLSTSGTPAARPVWSHDSAGGASFTKTVTSQDNGDTFTCQAKWGDRVIKQTSYTLRVAYGPSNAAVTGPSPIFDTNGSQTLTLTCQPTTSNPSVPNYSWRRLSDVTSLPDTTSSISVVAATNLDGKKFECRASNAEFSQISAMATYTVNLNYPPVAAPVIHNYNNGDVTYAGDVLTMTCTVTGGKPVASTKVNFACVGKPDNGSDVTTDTDVSSSLTFNPLQAANQGLTCTCSASWKNYNDWYTHQATRTLTVYSPPSDPRIPVPSTGYPFLAGSTSVSLTCVSDTPGYPPASYNWTRSARGRPGSGGTLTFHTVTSDLHNRTVSCRASNDFTVDKDRPLVEASRRLQVYYQPVISVSAGNSSNRCKLTPDRTRCDVTEGEAVNIRCNSHSNPDPASTRWYKGHPGSSPAGPDSVLRVTSASHVTDNGVYSCQSITGDLSYSHPPLTSTYNLTVLVKYAASQPIVTSNNYTGNLTVREGDHVTVTCAARGRPIPSLDLYNDNERGPPLESAVGGEMVLEDTASSLNYVIQSAMCRHTATYRCTARNDVSSGDGKENRVDLSVLCSPRLSVPTPSEPLSVNYVDRPVQLTMDLEAFPPPDRFDFRFLGPGRNLSEPVTRDKLNISCWNTSASYAVTCNVTVDKILPEDVGYYSVQIANDVGRETIEFEIKYKASTITPERSGGNNKVDPSVIGGAVAAVLVVAAVVVFVTIFIVKRRTGSGKEGKRLQPNGSERTDEDDLVMLENSLYGTARTDQDDVVMIDNDTYERSGAVAAQTEQPGRTLRSDYEEIEVAMAKPVIKPKPMLGAAPSSHDGKNDHPLENKGGNAPQAPGAGVDNLHASVNKEKASSPPRSAPAGATEQSMPAAKPKPKKETKLPKEKKDKGREKKKGKKVENVGLCEEYPRSEGAVYGNSPLSMNPIDTKVYENYAFQKDDTEYANNENDANSSAADEARAVNPNGLLYSTIVFSESQQKKSKEPPPGRETTEYAGIDFTRRAPPAED